MVLAQRFFHILFLSAACSATVWDQPSTLRMVVAPTGHIDVETSIGDFRESSAGLDANVDVRNDAYDYDYDGESYVYYGLGTAGSSPTKPKHPKATQSSAAKTSTSKRQSKSKVAHANASSAVISDLDVEEIEAVLKNDEPTSAACNGEPTNSSIKTTCAKAECPESKEDCACACQRCVSLCEAGKKKSGTALNCKEDFKSVCKMALLKDLPSVKKAAANAQSQSASLSHMHTIRVADGEDSTSHVLRQSHYSYANYDYPIYDYDEDYSELGGIDCVWRLPWWCAIMPGNPVCAAIQIGNCAGDAADAITNRRRTRRRREPRRRYTKPTPENCKVPGLQPGSCWVYSVSISPAGDTMFNKVFHLLETNFWSAGENAKIEVDDTQSGNKEMLQLIMAGYNFQVDLDVNNNNFFDITLPCGLPDLVKVEGVTVKIESCKARANQKQRVTVYITVTKLVTTIERHDKHDGYAIVRLPRILLGPMSGKLDLGYQVDFAAAVDISLKLHLSCLGLSTPGWVQRFTGISCIGAKIKVTKVEWMVDAKVNACLENYLVMAAEQALIGNPHGLCKTTSGSLTSEMVSDLENAMQNLRNKLPGALLLQKPRVSKLLEASKRRWSKNAKQFEKSIGMASSTTADAATNTSDRRVSLESDGHVAMSSDSLGMEQSFKENVTGGAK